MMLRKLTISVPDLVGKFVDYKVRTCGYGSVSEYIRELIRLDQRFHLAQLDQTLIPSEQSYDEQRRPRRDPFNMDLIPRDR